MEKLVKLIKFTSLFLSFPAPSSLPPNSVISRMEWVYTFLKMVD